MPAASQSQRERATFTVGISAALLPRWLHRHWAADEAKKRAYIERYIPQLAIGLEEILGLSERQTHEVTKKLEGVLERSRKL